MSDAHYLRARSARSRVGVVAATRPDLAIYLGLKYTPPSTIGTRRTPCWGSSENMSILSNRPVTQCQNLSKYSLDRTPLRITIRKTASRKSGDLNLSDVVLMGFRPVYLDRLRPLGSSHEGTLQ